MLPVHGQQHSFSTHKQVFLWKGQSFWDRKCLDLRGTRTPNLRIHAECSNLLSYQGQTFAVQCANLESALKYHEENSVMCFCFQTIWSSPQGSSEIKISISGCRKWMDSFTWSELHRKTFHLWQAWVRKVIYIISWNDLVVWITLIN